MTPRRRHVLRALAAALVVAGVLIPVLADARVGGGQGFSSGSGGSRGFGGGGGGDIDAGLIYLLIRLVIEVPQLGVPLLIGVGFYLWWTTRSGGDHGSVVVEPHAGAQGRARARRGHRQVVRGRRRAGASLDAQWARLAQVDEGLSEPVLYDFQQLVFRRAYAAVSRPGSKAEEAWHALRPFVGPKAQADLLRRYDQGMPIAEVVIARTQTVAIQVGAKHTQLRVAFASSRVEGEDAQRRYVEETWTFRRATDATSLPPDDARRLGCPSCGAAVQTDDLGRCTNCGTAITAGQLQWQATEVVFGLTRAVTTPKVGPASGGEEPGYSAPTVVHDDLAAQMRAFTGRHPDFDASAWEARIHHIFLSLQAAWSEGRWQDARPYVTDAAWNTLRFHLETYTRHGLHNRLDDVTIHKMQVVKVTVDAWYEAVTVRLWASGKDYVEDARGKVVGGNAKQARHFSEYWTFIRAVGTGDTSADPASCPSCGAPLDDINAAGVCGYCDSVITTGQFDWVLSRIDQAEVYRG